MSRKKYELRNAGRPADSELAGALLKIIAAGVVGGIAALAGAKKLGEGILGIQERSAAKTRAEKEKYKEAVRKITENEL